MVVETLRNHQAGETKIEESVLLVSSSFRDVVFLAKLYGKFNEGSEPLFKELGFLLMALSAKCFSHRNVELVIKTITVISTFNKVAPAKFVRVTEINKFQILNHCFYKTCWNIQKLRTLFQVTFSYYSSKKLGLDISSSMLPHVTTR